MATYGLEATRGAHKRPESEHDNVCGVGWENAYLRGCVTVEFQATMVGAPGQKHTGARLRAGYFRCLRAVCLGAATGTV